MRSRGFTLVEALVALAVLSVGLLGASALLVSGMRQQQQALREHAAFLLVTDAAELLRLDPHDQDAPLAALSAAAQPLLRGLSPEASITLQGSIHLVTLRWRDARDAGAGAEVSAVVPAPMPVAS